ncbi:hypothetical protein OAU26_08295 [Mariniblastus sp.]|nr:hypothetical protein [Mariniblastus sp.]
MSHSIFGLKYNLNQMPKLTSLAAVLNLAFTRCSGEIDPEIIEKKQQSKRRRRWFQLGLRTLLILVTLASATIGWVVVELEQRRGEVPAIAWAEANYCYVDFSTRPLGTRNWWESIEDSLFGDSVRHFSCYSGKRGSSDLTELSRLAYFKNLKFLGIGGQSQVSDLSPLAELKNLEELNFDSTPVNDLSPLAGLKKLRTLTLGYTQVSDLTPLAELKNLEELSLREPR